MADNVYNNDINFKKVLVFNGSFKKEESGTLRVTKAFLKGIQNVKPDCDIEILHLADLNIKPCLGCLSCWGRTPGECVIKNDDIRLVRQKILEADVLIQSYPLYFFGMPGTVKNVVDRLLGMLKAYKGEKPPTDGIPYHNFRHDMTGKKLLVVSTCGYCQTEGVFDALLAQLDCLMGKNGYQALLCPQGKIFSQHQLDAKSDVYLKKYTAAGEEFASNGKISEETLRYLQVPMLDERRFSLAINKFWQDEEAAGRAQRKES
ncbi:MAG: flavodoxin family protein [Clostridia bacterium]|nr:flavodoxin family protein [Clostridia bacterium]